MKKYLMKKRNKKVFEVTDQVRQRFKGGVLTTKQ